MTTDVREDSRVLERLEFTPTCDASVRWWIQVFSVLIPVTFRRKCRRPAHWVGEFPCCGTSVLACNPHRRDVTSIAQHCGVHWRNGQLTWSKL